MDSELGEGEVYGRGRRNFTPRRVPERPERAMAQASEPDEVSRLARRHYPLCIAF